MNILFLCTANSCRSIMAEALLRNRLEHLSRETASQKILGKAANQGLSLVSVQSAGSEPLGAVNPQAVAALQAAGISVKGLASKSWHSLSTKPDVVITLCDAAQHEPCPVFLGGAIRSHWGMADPALAQGQAVELAFATAVQVLQKRVDALCTLLGSEEPCKLLLNSSETLQNKLDSIGKI